MKNSPFIILFLSIVCFFPGAPSASIFKDEFPEEIKEYANVFKPLRVQYEPWITTKNKKTFQPLWNSLKTLLSNKNTNDHVKSYLRQGQGHILYKLKEFQKAEKFFTSAIKLAEKVPDHYYYYSLNLLEMNDRNKAIEQVETFITLHKAYETNSKISFKKNIKSNYFKACCFLYISYHIQSKQVDKGKTVKKFLKNSLKYLKELLRLSDYKDNMYKLFIANTYQELGDYKHAEMYYLKSTKNIIDQEDKEKNSCNLIRCYYNQENKEEEMKKEIEKLRDFKFPLPVFKLSYELQTKGFKTYSNEVHKIAVKIRESKKQSILFAQHYCKEGFFYQRTKQFDEAIKNYILTIFIEELQKKRTPQLRFLSYCKLGEIYTSKNKYKEAETNLREAIKIQPTENEPYQLLLYCLISQGMGQKMEQFVRQNYLKIKLAHQLFLLCLHFEERGDSELADQLFKRAQKFSIKQKVSFPTELNYRFGCYFQKKKKIFKCYKALQYLY